MPGARTTRVGRGGSGAVSGRTRGGRAPRTTGVWSASGSGSTHTSTSSSAPRSDTNATNVPSYFAYFTFFKKLNVGYGAAIATVLTLIIVLVAAVIMRWQAHSEKKEAS